LVCSIGTVRYDFLPVCRIAFLPQIGVTVISS
jgi:hypothetical protein